MKASHHLVNLPADNSWYLIYTKPRQELVAQENLERQGYMTYLPRIERIKKRHGKRLKTIEAFFPRYLFISLNKTTDNWSSIRSTIGVANMVRFSQFPAVVPDSLISQLMHQENPDSGFHEEEAGFVKGSKVRITEGALSGYEGMFEAQTGEERVIILLNVMGNLSNVKVDIDSVESVS